MFLNIGQLLSYGSDWARRSACDRGALQLLAGVPDRTAPLPGIYQPLAFSLDVRLEDLPYLVGEGAITPRAPTTDADEALIQAALKQPSLACPSAA